MKTNQAPTLLAEVFNPDVLLDEINAISKKKRHLEQIVEAGKINNAYIFFEVGSERQIAELTTSSLPFCLCKELTILINDSIDLYDAQIKNIICQLQNNINEFSTT